MEFTLNIIPPTVTAQEHKVMVRHGKPRFYDTPKLKAARNLFILSLSPHKPATPLQGPLALTVEQLTGGTEAQKQSNSEMAAAAQGLQGLPADIANAIAQSLAGIGITIDGQMLIGYVNSALGNMVNP